MAFYCGTSTYGSTGVKNLVLPLDPIGARFSVCNKNGTAENFEHRSIGVADGTRQHVHSTFQDTTGGKSENTSGKVIRHYERIGGVITLVMEANLVSFGVGTLALNVTVASSAYQILLETWD